MFETTLYAGWGDMDFNGHMRNTAYLDKAGDTRMRFFETHGFPVSEFSRLRLGPVVMKDEVEYLREIGLMESFRVTLAVAGQSADGSRFLLRNEFFKADGRPAARLFTRGGWLDLAARKLVAPPAALVEAMDAMGRTEDFQHLPSRT
ncbi:thioesterase family protein [Geothrix sp. 21YS21S-4]|uniref:thioesterase family protein n=1 Tax=Geothrix sp. 21YS21S-4 TaxID=3068889 RepID=UPI0027BAF9BB|nr:thioesterase family protein [Geothrix sp. 21YS21S-4]